MVHFFSDAHRALELLEDYHTRLTKPQDRPLKTAIERVIRIFKSRLFQALLGKLVAMSGDLALVCELLLFKSMSKSLALFCKAPMC